MPKKNKKLLSKLNGHVKQLNCLFQTIYGFQPINYFVSEICSDFKPKHSIEKTHSTVGNAVMITSIAISLGFLTLCFSNFIPTVIFGLFTSLAMIFAMIGVLITLPSILNYLR